MCESDEEHDVSRPTPSSRTAAGAQGTSRAAHTALRQRLTDNIARQARRLREDLIRARRRGAAVDESHITELIRRKEELVRNLEAPYRTDSMVTDIIAQDQDGPLSASKRQE